MTFSFSHSIPSNMSLLISSLFSFVTVKLDALTFVIWGSQFQNILQAIELLRFVDGSSSPPFAFIKNASGSEIPNPERTTWDIIDAYLLSCLTSTLSPLVYSTVLHLEHGSEVWSALIKRFTTLSRSHIHQLKN